MYVNKTYKNKKALCPHLGGEVIVVRVTWKCLSKCTTHYEGSGDFSL